MIDTCIDMDTEGDEPTLFAQVMRTARKQYACCECGSSIGPGDRYEHVKGLWDGGWQAYRTCRICSAIRRDFCASYIFGMLWEAMQETHGLGFDSIDEDWCVYEWSDAEWAAHVKRGEEKRKQTGLRTFSSIATLTREKPKGAA